MVCSRWDLLTSSENPPPPPGWQCGSATAPADPLLAPAPRTGSKDGISMLWDLYLAAPCPAGSSGWSVAMRLCWFGVPAVPHRCPGCSCCHSQGFPSAAVEGRMPGSGMLLPGAGSLAVEPDPVALCPPGWAGPAGQGWAPAGRWGHSCSGQSH